MLFHSHLFLFVFLPVVCAVFFLIGRFSKKSAAAWLGIASLFFYSVWSIKALPLLLASIVFNYVFGLLLTPGAMRGISRFMVANTTRRHICLWFALASNLGVLGFFKYADFFIGTMNNLAGMLHHNEMALLHVVLPIGISFYTFTQIAFLVDCYQGKVKERNFIHYLLFVTYFPHLIAGPILHHAQMMPQFSRPETYHMHSDKIALGLAVFAIGIAKKILIADPLGEYADVIFQSAQQGDTLGFLQSWLGVLAYSMQIYFDFSGYSDMAIGLSLLFGIYLPFNFNSPYKATSIIEFWHRWHMTLSTFLRDYLYIPLGGNRKGSIRRYGNLLVTMVLGGLWHGANWTFVWWGAVHGTLLVINHTWRWFTRENTLLQRMGRVIGWPLTFAAVCGTWVVFRAANLDAAIAIYRGMAGFNGIGDGHINGYLVSYMLLALIIVVGFKNTQQLFAIELEPDQKHSKKPAVTTMERHHPFVVPVAMAASLILLFWVSILKNGSPSAFLYFQF